MPLVNVLIGGSLGTVSFLLLFGTSILDPQYISWLLESSHDSIQHFVGWEFFRNEPWHFPLGVITSYGYPVPTSIVYTDSIPLLAIVFKCLSPWLPAHFQYFGIWFAFCFFMQGVFAWLLSGFITKNNLIKVCTTLLFLLSPIMLNRMIEHQALASHWLILAGFYLYLRPYEAKVDWCWLVLNIIAVLIHAYLAFMLFTIWLAFIGKQLLIEKNITLQKTALLFSINSSAMTIVGYIAGYFVIAFATMASPGSYNMDAMNLFAPLRPTTGAMILSGHWSRFIDPLVTTYIEQGNEGFNYFGLGVLVLIAIGGVYILFKRPSKKMMLQWLPIIFICTILALYALSNTIYAGSQVVVSYHILPYLHVVTDVFRASGRFFWPCYYLMMLMIFVIISQRMNKKGLLATFCGVVILQYADLAPKITGIHRYFSKVERRSPEVVLPLPTQIDNRYAHLVFLPPVRSPQLVIKNFGYYIHYAATHHLSVNIGYFARNDNARRIDISRQLLIDTFHGNYLKDTIYVITNRPLATKLISRLSQSSRIIQIEKHTVIIPQ